MEPEGSSSAKWDLTLFKIVVLTYEIKPLANTFSNIFPKDRISRFRNPVKLVETFLILLPDILFREFWFSFLKCCTQWLWRFSFPRKKGFCQKIAIFPLNWDVKPKTCYFYPLMLSTSLTTSNFSALGGVIKSE